MNSLSIDYLISLCRHGETCRIDVVMMTGSVAGKCPDQLKRFCTFRRSKKRQEQKERSSHNTTISLTNLTQFLYSTVISTARPTNVQYQKWQGLKLFRYLLK